MFETMQRLHPRGASNRGVCVDALGAMLGPECVLVERTPNGFSVVPRGVARHAQHLLFKRGDNPDWLYEQSRRIADALNRGEIALAQIYGLRIPVGELDGRQLKQLAAVAPLAKADFNPDEPRVPAGQPGGGEWTSGGGSTANAPDFTGQPGGSGWTTGDGPAADLAGLPVSALSFSDEPAPPSPPLTGGRWPAPTGASANPLYQPAQAEEDENSRGGGLLGDFMNLPREYRQLVYDDLYGRLREIEPGNPALQTLTGPDDPPTQADIDELYAALLDAQERAGEPPDTRWQIGWGARGIAFEWERLAGNRALPSNTPTIDGFPYNVTLSIKSIDLNAPWYRNPLNRRLSR